ncbi:hypothetical protein BO86DRAFT_397111 [Aspergillus japonicus CBS 114.51]|uniref:C2H2 type zinc finger domain protein n=1 Tax=Aspergillus japonicus CBS 114.51 TaxID=1448312 RepID=A0A8T8X8A8_ASPJA|nr:hypothetical protein BO86DRAFT_397111 [Aspergillus japonicus CBS 114.51]RAH84245.1 hypothetical protein BO86DRAFT_397111 [Aspergillus japonicus CBS 114.51]
MSATEGSVPHSRMGKGNKLWCDRCDRTYERSDHFLRHLQSHDDLRHYQCSDCNKAFNRGDLLYRHKRIHEGKHDGRLAAARVSRACQACVQSKTKCRDKKPCERCISRKIPCLPSGKRPPRMATGSREEETGDPRDASTSTPSSMGTPQTDDEPPPPPTPESEDCIPPLVPASMTTEGHDRGDAIFTGSDAGIVHGSPPPDVDVAMGFRDPFPPPFPGSLGGNSFPESFLPQVDCTELDGIDLDWASLQMLMQPLPLMTLPEEPQLLEPAAAEGGHYSSPASSRFESFERSPWLWTPHKSDNAYAGQQDLRVSDGAVNTLLQRARQSGSANADNGPSHDSQCHPHHPLTAGLVTAGSRDRILLMIHVTSSSGPTPLLSFPSEVFLEHLVQIYFRRQISDVTAWIHGPSFSPIETTPELLATIIAAGASYTQISPIRRMGYALQERARLSLSAAIEKDNSQVRQLETIQAYLLWVSMGLWSGFKRNMEVAESFLHAPITMLHRHGCFSRSRYRPPAMPTEGDGEDALDQQWRAWITEESFKRATLFAFITDMRCSMAYLRPPATSFSELVCPLPASRELWHAPSATMWKSRYHQLMQLPSQDPGCCPSWLEISLNPQLLGRLPVYYDKDLIALVVVHGMWPQIWSYQESVRFFWPTGREYDSAEHDSGRAAPTAATTTLWLHCQSAELTQRIQNAAAQLSAHCTSGSGSHIPGYNPNDNTPNLASQGLPVQAHMQVQVQIQLVAHFCLMALAVSPRETQQFAGRRGEAEAAASITPLFSQYMMQRPELQTGVWQAGQILRCARILADTTPHLLRGFWAVPVYQASLTLWTYGLMMMVRGTNPIFGSGGFSHSQPLIFLDSVESPASSAFVRLGTGVPGIRGDVAAVMVAENERVEQEKDVVGQFIPITDVRAVMEAVCAVLYRQDQETGTDNPPPLLEGLRNLMRDLGNLNVESVLSGLQVTS